MSATFILVIMSLTAQFLVNFTVNSNAGNNIVVQGKNAYFAARSGWEWATTYVKINAACPVPNPTTLTLTQGSLIGFRVQVSCVKAGATSTVTAVATYGTFGQFGYVTRTYTHTYP